MDRSLDEIIDERPVVYPNVLTARRDMTDATCRETIGEQSRDEQTRHRLEDRAHHAVKNIHAMAYERCVLRRSTLGREVD